MRILAHPDFLRLEEELVRLVGAAVANARGRFPRIVVIAASRRQVDRVRSVLADAFPALAGVEVLTHLALAMRLVEEHAQGPVPRLGGRPLREAVVQALLEGGESRLNDYARDHESVIRVLSGLFQELREAGIRADVLENSRPPDPEIPKLFGLYEAALDEVANADPAAGAKTWTDRAGLTRLATAAAARAPEFDLVVQYGAYELVGMNLDLVRALPAHDRVFLIPADTTAPAWGYARGVLSRDLAAAPELLDQPALRPFVAAARTYRDWTVPPVPLPEGAVEMIHAQGPESELNAAVRLALDRIRRGTQPSRIAILARSLEEYAPVTESVFARHGVPVDTSLGFAVSRHPKPRVLLALLRAMLDQFPRQKVIDLARMASLQRQGQAGTWTPDLWDRWSRTYRIVRGLGAWTQLPEILENVPLPESAGGDPQAEEDHKLRQINRAASARVLADMVREWDREREAWAACRSAADHHAFLNRLAKRWVHRWTEPNPVQHEMSAILQELEALESGALAANRARGREGTTFRLGPREVYGYLESACRNAKIPLREPGGIHFLDLMQARGLTFDVVYLIGFNADLIPLRHREDVFLPDTARTRLRAASGRPLAVRSEGVREEHLLLAQTLASVGEHLTLSWQRADSQGSARPVSLQLREVARLCPGSPSLDDALENVAGRYPTHPARGAAWALERTGMLTREEAVLLTGDVAIPRSREAAEQMITALDPAWHASLDPGLRFIESVERFQGGDRAFDGALPAGREWGRAYSPSALQRMAVCPQTFFFQHVLGVRPLDEAADDLHLDSMEVGSVVHQLLERVYGEVFGDARLPETPGRPQMDLFSGSEEPGSGDRTPRALEAMERHWPDTMGRLGLRMRARFPVLWQAAERIWRQEIGAFLQRDLPRLAAGGFNRGATETAWTGEWTIPPPTGEGEPAVLPVYGKLDRVMRDGSGRVLVTDYKTGGNLRNWVKATEVLRGYHLQLPVYILLAEEKTKAESVEAELLGLGPSFLPDDGFVRDGAVGFESGSFDKLRAGFLDTLYAFHELNRGGRFPFRSGEHCSWCSFRPACRKHHIPTRTRVESHPDHADYFKIGQKTLKQPLVADVTGPREEEDE